MTELEQLRQIIKQRKEQINKEYTTSLEERLNELTLVELEIMNIQIKQMKGGSNDNKINN